MQVRKKVFICIGSNVPDAMERVSEAIMALDGIITQAEVCGPYSTLPYPPAPPDGPAYANAVMCGYTEETLQELKVRLKALELTMGRRSVHKSTGRIVIDLDVVVYDNEICRHGEFEADYFRHGYLNLTEKPSEKSDGQSDSVRCSD